MATGSFKVLAIDDNRDNLVTLSALLKETYPEVLILTTIDGEKGIELALKELPDIILLDIVMPGMDGFEVCRQLKAEPLLMDIPVVFLTAIENGKNARIQALGVGGEGFLSKPIDETELAAQIHAMLKISRANKYKQQQKELLEKLVAERTLDLKLELAQRKQAEGALSDIAKQHEAILQSAMDGFLLVDTQGNLLEVNDAYCQMSGYSKQELLSMRIHDLEADEAVGDTASHIHKIVKEGFDRFESHHRRKDGSKFDILVSVQYRPNGGGRFVAFLQDIIDRKRAERALQDSETKHISMITNISDVIGIIGTDGLMKYKSPNIMKWFGWEPQDLIGTNGWLTVHPDDLERIQKEFYALLLRDNSVKTVEYRYKCKDGAYKWIELTATNLVHDPVINGVLLNYHDITERKSSEEALQESLKRLEIATGSAQLGIWDWDIANNKMTWDDQMFRLYGIAEKPAIYGVEIWQTGLHPDDAAYAWEECQAAIRGERKYDIEFRVKHPDGSIKFIKADGTIFRDSDGKAVRMLGVNQDITDRKATDDKIKASLAEKEVILKEIHHRVKNNMQVISSLLNMQSKYIKDKDDLRLFQDSQQRIQSMSLVYNKLYQSDDLANISFSGYLNDLVAGLIRSYNSNTGRITTRIEAGGVELGLDLAIPCGLIINEVISNSLKYAFPNGRPGEIRVIMRNHEGRIEMSLGDNGVGIPPGIDINTSKTLGMSLLQTLAMHQLGGTLELKRENGTEYFISFPYEPQESRV